MLGVLRIVERRAPEGHHGVADELVHRAAAGVDDGRHGVEVAREQFHRLLGAQLLRQGGEVGQVGEHDRHLAHLAAQAHEFGLGHQACHHGGRHVLGEHGAGLLGSLAHRGVDDQRGSARQPQGRSHGHQRRPPQPCVGEQQPRGEPHGCHQGHHQHKRPARVQAPTGPYHQRDHQEHQHGRPMARCAAQAIAREQVVHLRGLQFHAGKKAIAPDRTERRIEQVRARILKLRSAQRRPPDQHDLVLEEARRQEPGLQRLVVRARVEGAARATVGQPLGGPQAVGSRARHLARQLHGQAVGLAEGAAHHEVVVGLHQRAARPAAGGQQALQRRYIGPQRGIAAVDLLARRGQHHRRCRGHRTFQRGILLLAGRVGEHHIHADRCGTIGMQALDQACVQAARKGPMLLQLLEGGLIDRENHHGIGAPLGRRKCREHIEGLELQCVPGPRERDSPGEQQHQRAGGERQGRFAPCAPRSGSAHRSRTARTGGRNGLRTGSAPLRPPPSACPAFPSSPRCPGSSPQDGV